MPINSIFDEISENVVKGAPEEKIRELTQRAVNQGYQVKEIMDKGLIAGLEIVGAKWKEGEAFIPEVLLSAKVMAAGMDVIRDLIVKSDIKPIGTIAIGTVKGDVHSIGKSLVAMLMEASGFEVHDLGIDVYPERFVEVVREKEPDLLGMSTLLTTTMPRIEDTIKAIEQEGLRVITMIGGAPVTQEYADSVRANCYAPDAASAVAKAKELLGISS